MTISAVLATSLAGMRASEARALAIAQRIAQAGPVGPARPATPTGAGATGAPGGTAPVSIPMKWPEWPEDTAVNLPAELLDLTETQIAYTANLVVLETGADFWDMLATALERRDGSSGGPARS